VRRWLRACGLMPWTGRLGQTAPWSSPHSYECQSRYERCFSSEAFLDPPKYEAGNPDKPWRVILRACSRAVPHLQTSVQFRSELRRRSALQLDIKYYCNGLNCIAMMRPHIALNFAHLDVY
jgi:hypothetical protein